MAKANPLLAAFNAGELGPLLEGRADLDQYRRGGAEVLNWLPTVEGPLVRRAGTRHMGELKDFSGAAFTPEVLAALRGCTARFLRFVFNNDEAYIVEIGPGYIRLWTDGGQLVAESETPVEVPTPFGADDLIGDDGELALDSVQAGDILHLASGRHPVQQLRRLGATVWDLVPFEPVDGPFQDRNLDPQLYFHVTAEGANSTTTGPVVTVDTLPSLIDPPFRPDHVGCLFRLWHRQAGDYSTPWEAGKSYAADAEVESDGKFYRATNAATSGSIKPTHDEGIKRDGKAGVLWQYIHGGFGIIRITEVVNSQKITGEVITELPDGRPCELPSSLSNSGYASDHWELGAWNAVDGYPDKCAIWRERLVFARGRTIWFSRAGDFSSFSDRTDGDVLADDGISLTLEGDRVARIKWLVPQTRLMVGTDSGELVIQPASENEPFGPGNRVAFDQTGNGGRAVKPVVAQDRALFVQRAGRRLLELDYRLELDRIAAEDLTQLADHVTTAGITAMAWQGSPDAVLWCVMADGTLAALTYDRRQEVIGWHRHAIAGTDAMVHDVQTIPRADGSGDEVWLAVSRRIAGQTRHSMERLERPHRPGEDRRRAFCVDAGLTYEGPPTTSLSGLDHLEGETVAILADGAEHPPRIVEGGSIGLQRAASLVSVGLAYDSRWRSMRIEAGAQIGTAQGQRIRIAGCTVRLLETAGLAIGSSWARMARLDRRSTATPYDTPEPLMTGDRDIAAWPGGWAREQRIHVLATGVLPAALVALVPRVLVNDT